MISQNQPTRHESNLESLNVQVYRRINYKLFTTNCGGTFLSHVNDVLINTRNTQELLFIRTH